MPMTPDAKRALSTTIRSLRERLLIDLHDACETAYRLSIRMRDAGLDEAARTRRARFESWMGEQVRAQNGAKEKGRQQRSAADFRLEAEKQAAYTLLNRLVLLRLMEAPGPNGQPLRAPEIVKGGWESRAYKELTEIAPALVRADEAEGYTYLLQLVFEDLATADRRARRPRPGTHGAAIVRPGYDEGHSLRRVRAQCSGAAGAHRRSCCGYSRTVLSRARECC